MTDLEFPTTPVSMRICATSDVLPWPCACKRNRWDHEWGAAAITLPSGHPIGALHLTAVQWCGNCDCCLGWRPTPLAPHIELVIEL